MIETSSEASDLKMQEKNLIALLCIIEIIISRGRVNKDFTKLQNKNKLQKISELSNQMNSQCQCHVMLCPTVHIISPSCPVLSERSS